MMLLATKLPRFDISIRCRSNGCGAAAAALKTFLFSVFRMILFAGFNEAAPIAMLVRICACILHLCIGRIHVR